MHYVVPVFLCEEQYPLCKGKTLLPVPNMKNHKCVDHSIMWTICK